MTTTMIKEEEDEDSNDIINNNYNDDKFKIVTYGLSDYSINLLKKQSKQKASTIIDYVISINEEINSSTHYKKDQIQVLSQLSTCYQQKPFLEITRQNVLSYLNSCRKPEEIDPLHKWIGTYNLRRIFLLRFFKWLYNPDIEPGKRPTPDIMRNIPKFKRKEPSIYKPTDLWTKEDDLLFLKYCPSKRDRCYHTMSTMSKDMSARPSEILNLRIKDVVFKTNGTQQYAEVLVNGKTGSRPIPLFSSVPYIKDWLDSHPQRGNKNTYLISSLDRK